MASPSISLTALEAQCAALDCAVPSAALPALATYLALLTKWNKVMNLVGTRSWQETLRVLLVDSFHLADFLESLDLPEAPQVWDLGAGAGLPGIPLRMVWQRGHYYMVEAREKRALFLSTVLASVPLPGTHVFRGRAEDFFGRAPKAADMVVSRAFLPWPQVLELVAPHLASACTAPGQPEHEDRAQRSEQGGRVVFLALDPPPAALPAGWAVEQARTYTVQGKSGTDTRHFWSLRRQPGADAQG